MVGDSQVWNKGYERPKCPQMCCVRSVIIFHVGFFIAQTDTDTTINNIDDTFTHAHMYIYICIYTYTNIVTMNLSSLLHYVKCTRIFGQMIQFDQYIFNEVGRRNYESISRTSALFYTAILFMAEILHHLKAVVYPVIYRVLYMQLV